MPDFWPWGIAATCFGVALGCAIKLGQSMSQLETVKKRLAEVEGELAALKATVQSKEKQAIEAKYQPIPYPENKRLS